eukprot:scaffold219462_cov27-Tisochrysis_lutea.AAC.1
MPFAAGHSFLPMQHAWVRCGCNAAATRHRCALLRAPSNWKHMALNHEVPAALCPPSLMSDLRARSVQVDISISDDSGPRAARFLAQQ